MAVMAVWLTWLFWLVSICNAPAAANRSDLRQSTRRTIVKYLGYSIIGLSEMAYRYSRRREPSASIFEAEAA